jgi:hypothetical protein
LEVDAIVTALADDVLESFNPDPDYDGIPGINADIESEKSV